MRVTLREIADAAGLSVSTASRALNGHPAISAGTVTRVRRVAELLRYRRVRSHRRLDITRAVAGKNVAVISLAMDPSLIALPVVTSAINGAEAGLSEAGAGLRLAHVPDLEQAPRGLHPSLTTFDIHAEQIGRLAVRQLAVRLSAPDAPPDAELMIRPTLVEGQSVATIS